MRFDIAVADPDWWYNKRLNEQHGGNRTKFGDGVWYKYRTPPSDLKTIKAMPVGDVMKPDSLMHLWVTGPHLGDALEVLEEWEFEYVTIAFVWVKITKKFVKECTKDLVELGRRLLGGQENIYEVLIEGTKRNPGNWTASNVELVLLGKRGTPARAETVHMYPQLIFTPLPKVAHTKPDRVHEYIDQSFPESSCVEFYARRQWEGVVQWPHEEWVCLGNEVMGQEGVDMRESIPILRGVERTEGWERRWRREVGRLRKKGGQ